jgi:alkylation response protein AidB-like acyl-CoA dehydrogenase
MQRIFVRFNKRFSSGAQRNCLSTFRLHEHPILSPLNGLNDREKQIYNEAREFGEREFKPFSKEWDATSTFPRELMKKVAAMGYGGVLARKDVGGKEYSRKDSVLIFEALAKSCVSTTAMITIHNACSLTIDKFASPRVRDLWAKKLINMEMMGSFCITEPGAGSDAQSLITKADFDETTQEFVITGEKCFISGAGESSM